MYMPAYPDAFCQDYTTAIDRQNRFLEQKMVFFYGIAVILLLISLFHIMNSISYLVISRRREFGILRAMGITDSGFMKMMVREGVRYGIYANLFMLLMYVAVRKILAVFYGPYQSVSQSSRRGSVFCSGSCPGSQFTGEPDSSDPAGENHRAWKCD